MNTINQVRREGGRGEGGRGEGGRGEGGGGPDLFQLSSYLGDLLHFTHCDSLSKNKPHLSSDQVLRLVGGEGGGGDTPPDVPSSSSPYLQLLAPVQIGEHLFS